METKRLTASDKMIIQLFIMDTNALSAEIAPLTDDLGKLQNVAFCLEKCQTIADLPDLFRHVHNLELVERSLIGWKMLEVLFGPLVYSDDKRFKDVA